MNNKKGITLQVVVMYVVMMTVTLAMMIRLVSTIRPIITIGLGKNIAVAQSNNFNALFISDLKKNKTLTIDKLGANVKISFPNGVEYRYIEENHSIYRNKVMIASNFRKFKVLPYKEVVDGKEKKGVDIEMAISDNKENIVYGRTTRYILKYW